MQSPPTEKGGDDGVELAVVADQQIGLSPNAAVVVAAVDEDVAEQQQDQYYYCPEWRL